MNYIKKILDKCPDCGQVNSPRQEVCSNCRLSLVESVAESLGGAGSDEELPQEQMDLEARVNELESQSQKLVKDSEPLGKSAKDMVSLEGRVSDLEFRLKRLMKDSESFEKSAKGVTALETRVRHLESQLEEIRKGSDDQVATLFKEKMPKTLLLSPYFIVRSFAVFGYLLVITFMFALVGILIKILIYISP